MSERTTPPSIAPKKKPANRPARATDDGAQVPSGEATTSRPSNGEAPASVGERIRRTAAGVAGSARSAISPRPEEDAPRPAGGPAASGPAAAHTPRVRTEAAPVPAPSSGPRRVRLAVARIDPWSVMKLSFLLSVAVGIMIVVAAAVVWYTLDGLAVFTKVNSTILEITGDPDFFNVLEYAAFNRVVSLATMIAVVDVVLLTALATIGAFLYNIVAALVGGVTVTLTDD